MSSKRYNLIMEDKSEVIKCLHEREGRPRIRSPSKLLFALTKNPKELWMITVNRRTSKKGKQYEED